MKTEPWGSHGGRRVARSASIRALPFRFCIFAMLAALLPLVAFAHSASAQTNTPAPVRPRPHAAAPRPAAAAQAPANDACHPVPQSVAARCRSGHNGRQSIDAPRCDARATRRRRAGGDAAARHRRRQTRQPLALTSGPANAPAPSTNAPSVNAPVPAAPSPPGETTISTAELPQDLSPWGMFVHADIIVKLVMIGLAIASLVTWTVWLAKWLELRSARTAVRRDLRTLENCPTLSQAHEQLRNGTSPTAFLMQAAGNEIRLSASLRGDGLKERIAWQLERIEQAASRKMARGTGVLATIGSTAPFVGLFGTVWGIMDSFIGISKAHTTNLAVVAPGIAEALLATALGLVAAIPAVMIYNVLARSTAQYRALLGDASAQVMKLVSRDLDRAKLPLSQAAE